jgi:aldehyde dehydrogenase (NAD+)
VYIDQDWLAEGSAYIDGRWDPGAGDELISINPATGSELARYRGSDHQQLDAAVAAARRSFDQGSWRRTRPAARAAALRRLADLLDSHGEELAQLVVAEVGSPITLARTLQVGQPAANFRWMAGAAVRGPRGGYEERLPQSRGPVPAHSLLVREPAGVVAAITAYNYPLNLISWKLGPALAAGCSVVLLPSPRGALCALAFMRLAGQAGFPPGVINLVLGSASTSQRLAGHPDVDMVSFTGSSAVGSKVMELAADTTKKLVLELGGKSPSILLPGADLSVAAEASVLRFCRNAGQGCGVTSRILVHRGQYDEFAERAATVLRRPTLVGDPRDEQTVVGPLISGEHRQRVEGYLQRCLAGGGTILAGGGRPPIDRGFFVNPALVGQVCNDAEICREELFAPVAALLPYDRVDDAVAMANDSSYALNAAVWGQQDEAMSVARRLQSGTVAINGGGDMRADVPWGGGKLSGVGTEMGEDGFSEYFAVKHIQWPAS